MDKKKYIAPETEIVFPEIGQLMQEGGMQNGSWGVDGGHEPVKDDDGDDIIIYSKHRDLWDGWDE